MKAQEENRIRLLLVDDEVGFRQAIARRLARRGIQPLEAPTGEACLAMLEKEAVDVVVLDVKMPGMSGLDVLKIIRENHPGIQVILLTGNVAVSDGIDGIKAGAFDYLTKPVELDHLTTKIRQAYDKIRMEEETKKEQEYCKLLEKKMIDADRLMSLGTMSTGIAHEINNPLAIINEAAGFMKEVILGSSMSGIPEKEALLLGIEKIEKSVKRARKITHQLLGHVKKQESRVVEVDIGVLLSETLDLIRKEIEDKEISVHWETKPSSALIISDPYPIRQILINLLNNAVHAVKRKGSIWISIREEGAHVLIEIKDDGVGIPKEHLGKIFDPFFTTKSFEEGTGLGLFVVHKLLSTLGGDIRVDSTVGKGSSFVVRLPKQSDIAIRQEV